MLRQRNEFKDKKPPYLKYLKDSPLVSLSEGIKRAKRLVSERVGIINSVHFEDLPPGAPSIFFARSTPADLSPICGQSALNFGDAASIDPNRTILKAVGESVERYCSAQYEKESMLLSTYEQLDVEAVHPDKFALFSQNQYSDPSFPYVPLTATTLCNWVKGYSLTRECEVYVPAAYVFVPYQFEQPDEPAFHDPISTGLACGPNLTFAIYKGIMEVIERDAFMIAWQNQIEPPKLDPLEAKNPFFQKLLNAMEGMPLTYHVNYLTLDINVPVIQVILTSASNLPPYTVMGIGADLNPTQALTQALEEAYLTFLGMYKYIDAKPDFKLEPHYRNVTTPILHGLAHAMFPELGNSIKFLTESKREISINDIENASNTSLVENIRSLVSFLKEKDLEVIVAELTTPDIDEAGFKVARVIIPGMQPLDINHNWRYLGGERLYSVPHDLGFSKAPTFEDALNQNPHLFP